MFSSFLEEFKARGFMHQCTDIENLEKLQNNEKITAYIGFDCTAKSLHVGSLMQIMIFRLLQKYGHKPIVLVGGGTTKVGDPSFKDEARKMLDDKAIEENMLGIKNSIAKFIHFGDGDDDAIMLNNAAWLDKINYLEFLRDYGKHFSVNRMLSFDSVKLRLEREQNLSFLEFNYMLLQAYDFVELHKRENCRVQIGGSDQWGNIVNGIELNRRLGEKEIFGLTTPLITTASGAKMGKTVGGAVWLNEEMLPVYDYYQFWRNTEDADVVRFLKLYTDLDLKEILKLEKLEGKELNEAKKILAFEATKLCHGEEQAKIAHDASIKTFEQGGVSMEGLPSIELDQNSLDKGIFCFEILNKLNLTNSNGEGKRLIKSGSVKINDVAISDQNQIISSNHINEKIIKLSVGKKKHGIVKID